MSADDAQWWCEAYGPPDAGVSAENWPRCFVHPDGRRCSTPGVCAHEMAAERRRVFDRIQEGAVDGDETLRFLAEEFPTPGALLGGSDTEETR